LQFDVIKLIQEYKVSSQQEGFWSKMEKLYRYIWGNLVWTRACKSDE